MLKRIAEILRRLADRLDPPVSTQGGGPTDPKPPV